MELKSKERFFKRFIEESWKKQYLHDTLFINEITVYGDLFIFIYDMIFYGLMILMEIKDSNEIIHSIYIKISKRM